jgi:hypothetical protein
MLKKSMDTHSNRCLVKYRPPGPPVAATSSPETAQALSEARNTATNAISEASTMRQMALPRGESGAKSCRSASSGDTPSGWRGQRAGSVCARCGSCRDGCN